LGKGGRDLSRKKRGILLPLSLYGQVGKKRKGPLPLHGKKNASGRSKREDSFPDVGERRSQSPLLEKPRSLGESKAL